MRKVLIVDDNVDFAENMAEIVSDAGVVRGGDGETPACARSSCSRTIASTPWSQT
jgi:hypothetical protein